MNKEEWYKKRDDRSNRLAEILGDDFYTVKVGIFIADDFATSYSVQYLTIFTLNMLVRWCRRIEIIIGDSGFTLPLMSGDAKENIYTFLKEIDPYVEIDFVSRFKEASYVLSIGTPPVNITLPYYWINASGWISGFGKNRNSSMPEDNSFNILGPAFSACLGNSLLFKKLFNIRKPDAFLQYYSLYDFLSSNNYQDLRNPALSEVQNLGNIYQIGCGAVGSSLDYFLSFLPWDFKLHLIDYDRVEAENCNSSMLFTFNDADINTYKTHNCKNIFTYQQPEEYRTDYAGFIEEGNLSRIPPDVILCLANERNVWSTIQENFPPIVLHATTTQNWGINFGRHIPMKEWCIMCRFHNEIRHQFIPVCGAGEISIKGESETLGSLPFLSPAAAVVLLSEIVKLPYKFYPANDNFVQFGFLQNPHNNSFICLQRNHDVNCPVCNIQDRELHKHLISRSRYQSL